MSIFETRTEDGRNYFKILIWKPRVKRSRHRCEVNVTMDLIEVRMEKDELNPDDSGLNIKFV